MQKVYPYYNMFSHSVKQAIYHLELTSIPKTMNGFTKVQRISKETITFVFLLIVFIFHLPAFWYSRWCSCMKYVAQGLILHRLHVAFIYI